MPLVQDRLLDLLTSSPSRYHCATIAPYWYESSQCTFVLFESNVVSDMVKITK